MEDQQTENVVAPHVSDEVLKESHAESKGISIRPREIIVLVFSILLLLLIFQNMHKSVIDFLFWDFRVPVGPLLIGFFVVGWLVGWIPGLWDRFRRRD